MWPQMRRCCFECQRNKTSNQKPAGLLQPLPTPTEPWASVSMDFITQLPATVSGYDAIVVFVCRLTKMAHFVPTYTTLTAEELAYLYIAHIVKLHGLPKEIISDRDSKFTSHFGEHSVTSWALSRACPQRFTLRQMGRQKGSTECWKKYCDTTSALTTQIGTTTWLWLSLPTTMPIMKAQRTPRFG